LSADLASVEAAMLASARYFREHLSVEGSYVWSYDASDPASRSGEGIDSLSQGSAEPPGTSAVGLAFLEAYNATQNQYFIDGAIETANALMKTQLESGGWQSVLEFAPEARLSWCYRADQSTGRPACQTIEGNKKKNATSADDNISQSALTFLMGLDRALDGRAGDIGKAVAYGLDRFMEAQYPNGAFPFRFDFKVPDELTQSAWQARFPESWSREFIQPYGEVYITNDQLMRDTIRVFLLAHRLYEEPAYLATAKRAGDFLLAAQLPDPQPGWSQTYNNDLEPIWGRRFEPPSIASRETAGGAEALVELFEVTGEQRYMTGAARALDWLERSRLADGQWARFYEIESNKPLFFDQDYKLTYDSDDMPNHYAFLGDFGIASVVERYRAMTEAGGVTPKDEVPSEDEIGEILGALDDEGRWVRDGEISSGVFVRNMSRLADFAATERGLAAPDNVDVIRQHLPN
jgi:hypothetical protein